MKKTILITLLALGLSATVALGGCDDSGCQNTVPDATSPTGQDAPAPRGNTTTLKSFGSRGFVVPNAERSEDKGCEGGDCRQPVQPKKLPRSAPEEKLCDTSGC